MPGEMMKVFLEKMSKDDELRQQFVNKPMETLEANGVDPSKLPKEMTEKLAGGGTTTDVTDAASACACG